MDQKLLPEKVDEATRAVKDALAKGGEVSHFLPPQPIPETKRVGAAVNDGNAALAGLGGQCISKIEPVLEKEKKKPLIVRALPKAEIAPKASPEKEAYEQAVRPVIGFAIRVPDDAKDHIDYVVNDDCKKLESISPSPKLALPLPKLLEKIRDSMDIPINKDDARLESAVRGYLTVGYLGPAVSGRFKELPPFITIESREFFELHGAANKESGDSSGLFMPNSNHVMLNESIRDRSEADRMCIITHEELHYAAYLGGGYDRIRFPAAGGGTKEIGKLEWLNEGMTELHAQQLVRSHGAEPRFVNYPEETMTAYYLQMIIGPDGPDILRKAYLSGDYSDVAKAVDAKLGTGTFAGLMGMGDGPAAYGYLVGKMKEAPVDRSSWDKDIIVRYGNETIAVRDGKKGGGG